MLVVGVSVAAVMIALVLTARTSMRDQIATNADARAQDIGLLVQSSTMPDPIPGRGEDLLVQVFDSGGTVVASSASIDGQAPLVDISLGAGETRTFTVTSLAQSDAAETPGEGGADTGVPFLISARGVASPSGNVTVVVAASLNPVQQMLDVLVPRLAVGLPVIMLIVAGTVWFLTGLALRPVEAIRSEAEAISATSLERRVPEPGTSDEIARLAETVNRMLDRLEASSLAQRQFVSDASHELKSPIASIRTMLDVARREQPADLAVLLDDLAAEDLRLEQLVVDLLALARIDEGPAPSRAIEVDFDDVVLAEVGAIRRVAHVEVNLAGVRPARLLAERDSLGSLVRNLVENATRHASSTVWVALETAGDHAVLTVSDDGLGIAPGDRERVFERFVRLDESRGRAEGGTGLGLALCRAIAQSMNGSIRVAEPLHGGATFEVTLPLVSLR